MDIQSTLLMLLFKLLFMGIQSTTKRYFVNPLSKGQIDGLADNLRKCFLIVFINKNHLKIIRKPKCLMITNYYFLYYHQLAFIRTLGVVTEIDCR